MMQWDQLLSAARLGRDDSERVQPQRSPFQRDFDRVVFTSAFRRMQDKTQVFPLAEIDYVRTRLTHSLEAACVGRSLGTQVGYTITSRHAPEGIHASDIGAIVAAACLAHDIGNPPFGHSGEDAIRHWFATSSLARSLHAQLAPGEKADFDRFEGNAQGFRILTRLQMPDNRGGLQLTCATLGAFAKYPVSSLASGKGGGVSSKKFSFFHSELEHFAEVAERTGMLRVEGEEATWRRHPLAFIVEAADDICYRLVDFEDGMRIGILRYEEVHDAFGAVINNPGRLERAAKIKGIKERIEFLRALAIGEAVEQVAKVFSDNEAALLAGEFDRPLLDCAPLAAAMDRIVERSHETIYSSPRGVEIDAAGFEVVGGLLDLFVEAIEDVARHGKKGATARSRNLLKLIPEQFIGPGRQPAPDLYTRIQRITDYVAGMTDSFAVGLYKKLRGISLPVA